MKSNFLFPAILFISLIIISCEKEKNGITDDGPGPATMPGEYYIASYEAAYENVLRNIPVEYINKARNELHVAYEHTSHGTHVAFGLFGLPDYKEGDDTLFAITNNHPTPNMLDFRDNAMASYGEAGVSAEDLSQNEIGFIQATRNYLDDPNHANINVVMWSWCNIYNHDVSGNYIPGMETLISEYGEGGSKIISGQRTTPVTFIFMTGHANVNNNVGEGCPKNQADIIINHCKQNNRYCLDYYGIDTHCMDGNYWEDAGDDGNSASYGGNFYHDFENTHALGVSYYYNRNYPGGAVEWGNHNTQHITSNRKAYAMWYILARIAGWNGVTTQ